MGSENTDPKEFANKLLCDELVVTRKPVSPLGGAVIQSNQVLFKRVYDVYEAYGGKWNRQQVPMGSSLFELKVLFCEGFGYFDVSRRCPEMYLVLPSLL